MALRLLIVSVISLSSFVTLTLFAENFSVGLMVDLADENIDQAQQEELDEDKKEEQEEIAKMQDELLIEEPVPSREDDVPWQKPDFSNQSQARGWSTNTFDVPQGLERRVNFWKNIWGRYSSRQAVFHDSKYMDLIYGSIDFKEMPSQKELRQIIAKEKARIAKILLEIHKLQDTPERLEGEAKAIYEKFKDIEEKDKFKLAAGKGRISWHAGCKDRFRRAIYHSGRTIRQMEQIFKENNLPMELTRLPFVESMFNTHAYSRSRASGYWQFIPSTWSFMKRAAPEIWVTHRMKGSPAIDRRNDPIPATHAAAAYLQHLYDMPAIQSWPLALTAYNQGPGTIMTLRRRLNMTKDIAEIVNKGRARRFRYDGRNYYAQFLAVLDLEQNADKIFGPIKVAAPLQSEPIELTTALSFAGLSEFFKTEKEDGAEMARMYNPFLSRKVVNGHYGIPKGEEIRVPKGMKDKFVEALPNLATISPKVIVPEEGVHIVRHGENLSIIAAEWGVSINAILDSNGISRGRLIRPGQKLMIPLPGGSRKVAVDKKLKP